MNAGVRKDAEVGARQQGAEAFHARGASQGSDTEGGGGRGGAGKRQHVRVFETNPQA